MTRYTDIACTARSIVLKGEKRCMSLVKKYEQSFKLIQASLWGTDIKKIDHSTYEDFRAHAIIALPASILSKADMPSDLRQMWRSEIYQIISNGVNCQHMQETLPITVPYAVLKGTAAAQYYPNPRYRTMGDIDIMPCHEDYDTCCSMLLGAGFSECTIESTSEVNRHRTFQKDGITVEVHSYFSIFNDAGCSRYLDELIIRNITPSHILPDPVNGMVLLEHINQHIEEGIGLRQIIDWMLFVNRCLPDNKWEEFKVMAEKTGLLKLACVTTRMCEMYLGLPKRQWCSGTDENLCEAFMEYILSCGNFGTKREYFGFRSEKLISYMRTPKVTFTLLQKYGLYNWKAARKYFFLRPFAWIYQIVKYINKTVSRQVTLEQLKSEISTAKERNALFDALGVTQVAKGLVIYKDGKYVKE